MHFLSHVWGCSSYLSYLWKEEQEPPAWTQLKLPGSGPAPRCGHSTTAGGSQVCTFCQPVRAFKNVLLLVVLVSAKIRNFEVCGYAASDLWLNIIWLSLFQLLVFGGHGTGGWLTRYDIYHNDCVILDRGTLTFCCPAQCLSFQSMHPKWVT